MKDLKEIIRNCVINDGKEAIRMPKQYMKQHYCGVMGKKYELSLEGFECPYNGGLKVVDFGDRHPRLYQVMKCEHKIK
mgnify:CR=1 FL=1